MEGKNAFELHEKKDDPFKQSRLFPSNNLAFVWSTVTSRPRVWILDKSHLIGSESVVSESFGEIPFMSAIKKLFARLQKHI